MATSEEDSARAAKYVEGRLEGLEARSAARVAGYSDKTHISQIERPGGPVDNLMQKALDRHGISEDFLANEYLKGIEAALDGPEKDCQAHAKYLLQLGYLRGYGKSGPSVAVQINNTPASGVNTLDDAGRIEEALRETRDLLALVRAELVARDASGVPGEGSPVAGGDQLHAEASAHPGVVPAGGGA